MPTHTCVHFQYSQTCFLKQLDFICQADDEYMVTCYLLSSHFSLFFFHSSSLSLLYPSLFSLPLFSILLSSFFSSLHSILLSLSLSLVFFPFHPLSVHF